MIFQFDDVGTNKLSGISALRSNEVYAMSNASSSPKDKEVHGYKKQYQQQAKYQNYWIETGLFV